MTAPVEGQSAPRTRAALDELGRLLLAEEDTQSVLQWVVDLAKRAMPPGAEASVTLVRGEQAMTTAATPSRSPTAAPRAGGRTTCRPSSNTAR